MPVILLVDNDAIAAQVTDRTLRKLNFHTLVTQDGKEALGLARRYKPDLVLLEVQLAGLNGIELCRQIRDDPRLADIPVVFLSYGAPADKVACFKAGADDYISKDCSPEELEWRLRSLLRRTNGRSHRRRRRLAVNSLVLDCQTYQLRVGKTTAVLTPTEFDLVYCLMKHAGEVLSAQELLREVWGYPPGVGDPALVRQHVRNVRAKIEPCPAKPIYLQTVSRRGYTITSPPPATKRGRVPALSQPEFAPGPLCPAPN